MPMLIVVPAASAAAVAAGTSMRSPPASRS
jgi:hypothetical protein